MLKIAIDEYINELMNDRFKNAITQPSHKEQPPLTSMPLDFSTQELEALDFYKKFTTSYR